MIKRHKEKRGTIVLKHTTLFIFLLMVGTFSIAQAKIVEKIVAVVNGETITLSELENPPGPGQGRADGGKVDAGAKAARHRALEQLIEKKLLLQTAKDRDIEIREERINRRIEEIKKKFASEEEFRQALQQQDLTEAGLRKRVEEDLLVSTLIYWEVDSKIRVGGEEIRRFYEQNKERFREPEEVELSHIFIKVKEGGWGEKESKGKDLIRQLRNGADFSLLAKEYSDGPNAEKGGHLGFLTLGELSPEFEEAISNLRVGEVSGLIKMENGFHIIKLEGRKAARQMKLSEVKDRIEPLIFAKKWKRRYREWMDGLKKKAYIEIK